MRKPIVALIFSAFTVLLAPPGPARAEVTTLDAGESPTQLMDRVRAQAVNGQLSGAISQLEDFVRAHPEVAATQRLLGDLYFRKPDLVAAERAYKAVVQRYPNDQETWNRLGGLYAAEDRVDEAIAAFNKSVTEPSVYYNLVALHRRRGDLDQFEQQVATDAQHNPTDLKKALIYGNVLLAVHKYETAIAEFKQALTLAGPADRCPALNDLALAYLDVRRTSEAIPLLERCLAVKPTDYSALVNLAEANIELGKYDAARPYLDRALKSEIDRPEAYVDIGFLEDVAHQWKSAVANYQKAIAVDPLWRDAYINLGYDYNEQKLYALAEAAFIKGLSVAPNDGRLSLMLGKTYSEQGKVALAKQQYERVVKYSDEKSVVNAARLYLSQIEGTAAPAPGQ